METYNPTQKLIAQAQTALNFLRQQTEQGLILLDIENCPDVKQLQVEISGDWVGILVYDMAGGAWAEMTQRVYAGVGAE